MSIAELCTTFITDKEKDSSKIVDKDIMEFTSAPWGLGLGYYHDVPPLFPVQKFVLKCYYGLELDNGSDRSIIVNDQFNETELYRFNEKEYLHYLFDEGRVNKKNFEESFSNLVLVCGRRSGKCITGDSIVLTDKGMYRIEDIAEAKEEEFKDIDLIVSQEKDKRARAEYFYNGGVKDTVKVRTRFGYNINGTENHRIKVLDKSGRVVWKYLENVEIGDYVALNRRSSLWVEDYLSLEPYCSIFDKREDSGKLRLPKILDENLAELMGRILRDECSSISKDSYYEICEYLGEKEIRDFDGDASYKAQLRSFFCSLGCDLEGEGNKKRIPWSILRSPKSVVRSFLCGLFGNRSLAETPPSMCFSSKSVPLVEETQIVLLNMGIVCQVRKRWDKKDRRHHGVLLVRDSRSIKLLAQIFGSCYKNMVDPLEYKGRAKSGIDSIPNQKIRFKDLLESLSTISKGEVLKERKLKILTSIFSKSKNEELSYSGIKRIINLARDLGAGEKELKHFEDILELDYFFDPIGSIIREENQVYDLSVPQGKRFVANGMVNHNTTLTSCIISYETYRLLNKYCPQEYYGIMPEDEIRITCISTSKETASELFNRVTGHLERSEFFRKYRNKPTQHYMDLRSQRDIDKYGQTGRTTISIHVAPCSAKGLRGPNNIIVALDEMAFFFQDEKNVDKPSASDRDDRAIYNAVTPSLARFKRPDGTPDGKVICISSPFGKSGKFFDEYDRSFSPEVNDIFTLQAPTWEVDPSLSTKYLKSKFQENPIVFKSEFGAQFSDQLSGWIDDPQIVEQNIVKGLKPKLRCFDRIPHFIGIDVGLKQDGTAVCVCHWEKEDHDGEIIEKIEIDCCDVRYAEDENKEYFTPEEVAEWIYTYTDNFFIVKGLMDQYYGMSIIPYLEKKGCKQFEKRNFTETLNSAIYQNFMSTLISSNVRFPEGSERIVDGKKETRSDLVLELLSLQAHQKSKYLVKVQAPDRKGAHDDRSDAASRAIQLAVDYKTKGLGHKVAATSSSKARSYKMARSAEAMRVSLNRPSGRSIKNSLSSNSGFGIRRSFR